MSRNLRGVGRQRPQLASREHEAPRRCRARRPRGRRRPGLGRRARLRGHALRDRRRAAHRRQGRGGAGGRRRRGPGRALAAQPRRLGAQLGDESSHAVADRRRLSRRAGDLDGDELRPRDPGRRRRQDPDSREPRAAVPGRADHLRPARVRLADSLRRPRADGTSQPSGRRRLPLPREARGSPRRPVLDQTGRATSPARTTARRRRSASPTTSSSAAGTASAGRA